MALIVELRDARGQVTRRRLDGHALTLGRGLGNDVILDDPYVDACHARLTRDEGGGWSIADLGSVNGMFAGGTRADAAIPVQVGTELRIGRTLLRFRDTEEAVAPALVDDQVPSRGPAPAAPPIAPAPVVGDDAEPRPQRGVSALLGTTRGRLVVIGTTLTAFAVNGWLSDASRSPGGTVLGMVLTLVVVVSLWAAGWAAATRRADRRFHFIGHLGVVCAALLGALVAAEIFEWLTFLFPGAPIVNLLPGSAYLALVAAVVAGHLGVSGTLPPRRRWRVGAAVAGAIMTLTIIAAIAKDETFSDVPELPSALKPLSPAWIPAGGVDDFGAAIRQARIAADDAAKDDEDVLP